MVGGESTFPVQFPMVKAQIAVFIQITGIAGGKQETV